MRPFLVCIHDATPAHERATREIIGDLEPLIGRRLSFGVVPNWHGEWPLAAHPDYCALLAETSEELLLHGYSHQRRRGWGPVSLLADRCDEMNGLDAEETGRTLERGQCMFMEVFGAPARGFLAPGWQPGHVRPRDADARGMIEYVLGFLSVESSAGTRVHLATSTWDCGRWGWLGHGGDVLGRTLQATGERIPTLAIHPRDLARGFWPRILGVTRALLDAGYQPTTAARLLETRC